MHPPASHVLRVIPCAFIGATPSQSYRNSKVLNPCPTFYCNPEIWWRVSSTARAKFRAGRQTAKLEYKTVGEYRS